MIAAREKHKQQKNQKRRNENVYTFLRLGALAVITIVSIIKMV
jgi:hypothetical protein